MAAGIVLCVDDDITVLNALRSLIRAVDPDQAIEIAESGCEAIEICAQRMAERCEVSVVISDLMMPGMLGDELLIRLHQLYPQMIKIMLTGQSDLQGIKRTINGANLYRFIEKPFNNADLMLTVKSALQAYGQARELERKNEDLRRAIVARNDAERIAKHDLYRMENHSYVSRPDAVDLSALSDNDLPTAHAASDLQRVLVVDDDPFNSKVLSAQLAAQGVAIENAGNGRVALQLAMARRPDIIFMDIDMPVMGGIEAMRQIREYQQTRGQLPSVIIAFSSNDDAQNQASYLELGFDACMNKPCSRHQVLALLKTAGVAGGPDSGQGAAVSVAANLLAEIPAFLASRHKLLAQLLDYLEQEDREAVRRVAHKLTGSLAMFGFAWAANACKEIEAGALDADRARLASQAQQVLLHLQNTTVQEKQI